MNISPRPMPTNMDARPCSGESPSLSTPIHPQLSLVSMNWDTVPATSHPTPFHTNNEYRHYLQTNGKLIMRANTQAAIHASGNNPFIISNRVGAEKSPFSFHSSHDTRTPSVGYCDSDLKRSYLATYQRECRMISPQITLPD